MLDDNWELINGDDAHRIEALNAANTVNVIEALITFLVHHRSKDFLRKNVLCELHRTGTLFLLREPGHFRQIEVHVTDPSGATVHQPPPHASVAGHMEDFFSTLAVLWSTSDALDVASYALWRINWIHPFVNGNGRTARAFAYACLSAHLGVLLPGKITIIDQIMETRGEYQKALKAADDCDSAGKEPDLRMMKAYLNLLLQNQINSIL